MSLLPQIPTGAQVAERVGPVKNLFRAAAVARLLVRIEDFTNRDGPLAIRESEPSKTLVQLATSAVTDERAQRAQRRAAGETDVLADAQANLAETAAARAQAAQGTASAGSAPPGGAAADDLSFQVEFVPQDWSLECNGFRIADKAEVTCMFSDLPIDPELIRSVLLELYVGTVAVQDFAHPDRWVPQILGTPPMFRGYVDPLDMDADESAMEIKLTADSIEKRLMDAKVNPLSKDRRIHAGGEKLTAFVRRFLGTIPEFNGTLGDAMGVVMFPNVDPSKEPILDAKMFNKSLQSAQSQVQGGGGRVQGAAPAPVAPGADVGDGAPALMPATPSPTSELSVWDVITRACLLCGVMPVYDPTVVAIDAQGRRVPLGQNNLLLVPPQTVKQTPSGGLEIPGGPTDGFSRQMLLGGTSPIRSDVRFFVWGRNIKSMKKSRKFARQLRAPRVRVIGYNPDAPAGQRKLTAVFPDTKRATAVSAIGTGKPGKKGHVPIEEEVVRIVHGVRDQAQLQQIAVSLYHQIGHREISIIIETDEMSSFIDPTRPETQNENPDILRLRPGSPCRVTVGRSVTDPSRGLLVNSLSQPFDSRFNAAFLRKALITDPGSGRFLTPAGRQRLEDALSRLEDAYAKAALIDWYYCVAVRHKWSKESGYSVEIELANYVEARSGPANLSTQDKATNDQKKLHKAGVKPDGRAAAIASNTDTVLSNIARGRR